MPDPNFSLPEKFLIGEIIKWEEKKSQGEKVESSRNLGVQTSTISDVIRPKDDTRIKDLTLILLILHLSHFQIFFAWIN